MFVLLDTLFAEKIPTEPHVLHQLTQAFEWACCVTKLYKQPNIQLNTVITGIRCVLWDT